LHAVPVEDAVDARLQRLDRARGRKPEIEFDPRRPGNHVVRTGACVHVRDLPRRRRKVFVAAVPFDLRELRDRRRNVVHRISREMRVRDVALHAFDDELARERAAAAILDHVAGALDRGRLADDAVIELFAARAQRFDHFHGAIRRGPFLVGSKQESDRAAVLGIFANEAVHGFDESGDRRFHVRRAAPIQDAVADHRLERIAFPLLDRSGGNDVGVSGKNEQRLRPAAARPQIADTVGIDALEREAERREMLRDEIEAARIFGRHGRSRDERAREIEGIRRGHGSFVPVGDSN
jgi:hypothetical protein